MSLELSRREVRSLIFHVLYTVDSFNYEISVEAVIDQYNTGFDLEIPLNGEVADAVNKIIEQRKEFDIFLTPLFANWRLERIGCCTHLILYIALWELMDTETPSTIVINEAIELSKCFSEKDAYKFINGVLDQAVKKLDAEQAAQD